MKNASMIKIGRDAIPSSQWRQSDRQFHSPQPFGIVVKRLVLFALLLVNAATCGVVQASDTPSPSPADRIDALVDAKLAEQQLAPNPPIDDATFLRRIYLDLIGRIPTLEESEAFYSLPTDGRRPRLIDELLASEGYVSHWFNYWADILRIRWRLGINETPPAVEYAYRLWLKRALRENFPYDDFVRELVTARGHFWENGAIGYYQRDRGMPLDNMSNTVRIFLGTRLECAQCHAHPFDRWTQMDYYRMAAFSYGMESKGHTHPNREALRRHLEQEMADAQAKATTRGEDRAGTALAALEKRHRSILKAEENLHVRVRYITTRETGRTLQLPHDYQYRDAEPFEAVTAKTMFGGDIAPESLEGRCLIEAYADWMTAEDNPTFARVIANRLWKQLFGTGIFEPVDEITEGTFVSHPELMDTLEQLMRDLDYDLKAYLAVLCNTRAYQRAASREDLALGEPFDFRGPRLRRMSAEQLWDSLVGLVLPEADRYSPDLRRHLETIDRYRSIYRNLADLPPEKYIASLVDLEDTMTRMNTERTW